MKPKCSNLIEMITFHLYSIGHPLVVHDILNSFAEILKKRFPHNFVLFFKNEQVGNEWAIYFHHPAIMKAGKFELDIDLIKNLHNVKLVNHTGWIPCGTGPLMNLFKRI